MSQLKPQCPFPLWALPPTIRAAVQESIDVTQAPIPLVASSALAAASLAVQAKYDVQRLSGLESPCSLYFMTFAESGERKTTVDGMFFAPFRKFEDDAWSALHVENCDNGTVEE